MDGSSVPSNERNSSSVITNFQWLGRVTIRPSFLGHVLFLSPYLGIRAAFLDYGFCLAFLRSSARSTPFYYFFHVIYYKKFRELKTRAGIACVFSFRPLSGVSPLSLANTECNIYQRYLSGKNVCFVLQPERVKASCLAVGRVNRYLKIWCRLTLLILYL